MLSARMFADDTNISFSANNIRDLERVINLELSNLNQWLRTNRPTLNIAKTEFMVIGLRQRILANSNDQIQIKIDENIIKKVDYAKSLGVTIDDRLSWDKHIDEKSKKKFFRHWRP